MSKSLATRLSRISLEKYAEQYGLDSREQERKGRDEDADVEMGGTTTDSAGRSRGSKASRLKREKARSSTGENHEEGHDDQNEKLLLLVSQHLQDQPVSEIDIMAQFIYHVRNKDQELKWAPFVTIPSHDISNNNDNNYENVDSSIENPL